MTLLTDRERRTLRALCDAFVPGVAEEPPEFAGGSPAEEGARPSSEARRAFLSRRGSDLDLPVLIEAGLAETPPHLRAQVRRLLAVMASAPANLLLAARPTAVARMSPQATEAYLRSWGLSRIPFKRAAFNALKQLITFLFYAAHPPRERNPNWPAIGFPGTPPTEPARSVEITPLSVTGDVRLDADVCVIGSGAGGSVAAAVLAGRGRDVLILERGGFYSGGDYTGDEYEMLQRLSVGKGLFATADNSFGLLAASCLGGSTVVNWCTSLRPPPEVLAEWERDHGIDGLTGAQFRELLQAVEDRLNVNTLESRHNLNNQVLVEGASALGYRVETIPRNVRGCTDCGPCTYGCARGAKQDALVTYVHDACQAGARVLTRCLAERLVVRGGEVVAVEAAVLEPATGRRHQVEIRCRSVVLAGGAVFSPALLLRSGLGNSMVGQGLRLHPVTACLGAYPHPIEAWNGSPQTAVCTEFANAAGTHGFWIEAAPFHPGLAAMAVPWTSGRGHKDLMAHVAHVAALIVLVRDHGSGRVRLTRAGDPVVTYRLDPRDEALMLRGMSEIGKIHLAAGARELHSLHTRGIRVRRDEPDAPRRFADALRREGIRPNALALFSAHLMGSVPMGADSRRAAVDPSGRLYGVRNLYVADGSLFPSAPAVNPMITIMAMAMRVAGRL